MDSNLQLILNQTVLFSCSLPLHSIKLICPYCQREYLIKNPRLKRLIFNTINHHICTQPDQRNVEIRNMLFRCIYCDRQNSSYPFKYQDTKTVNKITLNEEQNQFLIDLYQQLLISSSQSNYIHKFMLIEGEAGTGKTSLITELFKYPEFRFFEICFTAMTNKALGVIKEKISSHCENNEKMYEDGYGEMQMSELNNLSWCKRKSSIKSVGKDLNTVCPKLSFSFLTIFKLLNQRIEIDEKGSLHFGRKDPHHQNLQTFSSDFIIIDEVSMVENKWIIHILDSVLHLNPTSKYQPFIIFLGDIAQLPPIEPNPHNYIFEEEFQQRYQIYKMTLKQIMRSKNQVSCLSRNTRQLVLYDFRYQTPDDIPQLSLRQSECQEIKFFLNRRSWIDEYRRVYFHVLNLPKTEQNTQAPIIIAYTNAECDRLNTECRNLIFNHPSDDIVKDEIMIFKKYYASKLNDGTKIHFFTSEIFVVKDIEQVQITIPCLNYHHILNDLSLIKYTVSGQLINSHSYESSLTHKVSKVLEQMSIDNKTGLLITGNPAIDQYLKRIRDDIKVLNHTFAVNRIFTSCAHKCVGKDTDQSKDILVPILAINNASREHYLSNLKTIKVIIKSNLKEIFILVKRDPILNLFFLHMSIQIWSVYYYGSYINRFADIDFGYAITSHKSQGSTYSNVFVNITDILKCNNRDLLVRYKSLYTSITRASQSLYLLHEKSIVYPYVSKDQKVICQECHQEQFIDSYPSNNYRIDKHCIEKILGQIIPMQVYPIDDYVIMTDKNKVLYRIPKSELQDIHINDAFEYINHHHLVKHSDERYNYNNVMLAKTLLMRNKDVTHSS